MRTSGYAHQCSGAALTLAAVKGGLLCGCGVIAHALSGKSTGAALFITRDPGFDPQLSYSSVPISFFLSIGVFK